MSNEFNIYITDASPNSGGYIECPICKNKMTFHKVKDSHEWYQMFLDYPYIITQTKIHLYSLHCEQCQTFIDNITLVATEVHQVVIYDKRLS